MEFKNAVTVCLIALFSATMVMLIARALDIQAASKIQPELQKIASELEALRKQGAGGSFATQGAGESKMSDGLMVYYLHGNTRCATCQALESWTHETVTSDFKEELASGKIKWEVVNYETPAGAHFVKEYEVVNPTVVLVRMENGKSSGGKQLDESFAYAGMNDRAALVDYLRNEIQSMLPKTSASEPAPLNLPTHEDAEKTEIPLLEVPIPSEN